jgi:SNF2 family DNA or RNA helicase
LNLDERSRAGEKLRHALEPFVLRRLKTDPMIMSELGEKREIKEYCPLTLAQRGEYEAALMDYRATARTKGDVFALITSLKLICDGMGKLNRLIELLTEIFSRGESALVFTQYAKVGAFLQSELSKRFVRKFPFLHGSLSAKERDDEIRRFNENENCFILSLKAGGFGLNLTKATHVIHYDRWWNPATENQATDRAHRIGQKSTVFVHLFITPGTLEERVDEILERKNRMAGMLVKNGESFLASLSDNMLMETVKLGDEL